MPSADGEKTIRQELCGVQDHRAESGTFLMGSHWSQQPGQHWFFSRAQGWESSSGVLWYFRSSNLLVESSNLSTRDSVRKLQVHRLLVREMGRGGYYSQGLCSCLVCIWTPRMNSLSLFFTIISLLYLFLEFIYFYCIHVCCLHICLGTRHFYVCPVPLKAREGCQIDWEGS